MHLIIAVILALFASLASYRAKFLNQSGAVATFILAVIIFGFGSWKWSIPILVFFISSSLLSKIGKKRKTVLKDVFEKGSRRDYAQVLANGGVAGLMMILYIFLKNPELYWFYLAAIAAATADTWATEIGTLSKQPPLLITNFKKVPVGTSGGITFFGISGAIFGAFILSASGWIYLTNPQSQTIIILLISASGFAGSIVDSLLGATIQIKFRCPSCSQVTEKRIHCGGASTQAVTGIKWMTNDVLNFLNTISAVIFLYILMKFI